MRFSVIRDMKRFLLYIFALVVPLLAMAQEQQESKQKYSIEIDARSLSPVQTDELSGVMIDPIGLDRSMRPCARIKMRINRMTRDEISQLTVIEKGGIIEVMKQIAANKGEGNGLIIELTAKPETRFYLRHPKYGDSNEVSLALEGNKEYYINAELNYLNTIVVSTNVANADVYIDNEFKGRTDANSFTLTVDKVLPGPHKIKVQEGQLVSEKEVEVSGTNIYFRIEINHEQAKPQYVVFKIFPKRNVVLKIDDNDFTVDSEGEASARLYNGTHTYSVTAMDYHDEKGVIVVQNEKVEKIVQLRPQFGWLTIPDTEELRGAKVSVDRREIGYVPISKYQLPSRAHDIRIVKEFYKPHEEKIVIQDSVTYTHAPKLVANYAEVTVSAGDDEDTYIYIDEERQGASPWSGKLTAQTYEFSARKENHRPTVKHVDIVSSTEPLKIELDAPVPIMGTLEVSCSPTIAKVYVDGKEVGETPLSHSLIIGAHSVRVHRDGYKDDNRIVNIKEGETFTHSVKLEKKPTQTPNYSGYSSSSSSYSSSSTSKSSSYSSYSGDNTYNGDNDNTDTTTTSPYNYKSYDNYSSSSQSKGASYSDTKRPSTSYRPKRGKKTDPYREHQSGIGLVTDLSYMLGLKGFPYPSLCWSLTTGHKFNNNFYMGVGLGLNLNFGAGASTRSAYTADNDSEAPSLKPSLWSVPLYGYMKVNFLNRRCSPFFALSAGGYLAPKQKLVLDSCETEYKTSRAFVNPQLGLDIRTSPNKSVFFAVGFQYFNVPCCYDYDDISATIENFGGMGLDIRVGVTF